MMPQQQAAPVATHKVTKPVTVVKPVKTKTTKKKKGCC